MRPGQQNKRMRGRGRGKQPNGINRVYESNGPDVKVRGTASHIAEKYLTLSRDAQAAGDPVASENYLQHAEHYFRIIASIQGQMQPQPQQSFGSDNYDDDDDDQPSVNGSGHNGQQVSQFNGNQPQQSGRGRNPGHDDGDQPETETQSAQDEAGDQSQGGRPSRHDRREQDRGDDGGRRDRNPRRRRRGGRDQGGSDANTSNAAPEGGDGENRGSGDVRSDSGSNDARQGSAEPVA